MTKKEFITEVSKRCGLTDYAIEEVYNASSSLIAEKLICGENVILPNLGKFELVTRKEMIAKNLFGESEKKIGICTYPIFKICNAMKTRVKNGCKYEKCQ